MPCRSDYMEAAGNEVVSRETAKLIVYVLESLHKKVPKEIRDIANEYYGFSGDWELWDWDWEPEADKEIETKMTTTTNKKYQTPGIYSLEMPKSLMDTTTITKTVIPFNGEQIGLMSWSHGFTHYLDINGEIGFCGQNYFEENAAKIPYDLITGHTIY